MGEALYDTRGLLTDRWNPTSGVPGGTDPHTHYYYYRAVGDRLDGSGQDRDVASQLEQPAGY